MKKFVIGTLLVASVLGGVGGVIYGARVKNTHYSKEQYELNYRKGYDVGCGESVAFKKQLQEYSDQLQTLTTEKKALEVLKEDYKQKYEKGLITIEEYEIKNSYLDSQVKRLLEDIEYCQQLLAESGVEGVYAVLFKVDGEVIDNQLITADNTSIVAPLDPVKEHYNFLGWSKDGINVIEDFSTEVITENTTYNALFEEKTYSLTFETGDDSIIVNYKYGSNVTIPEDPEVSGKIFLGWSENGKDIVDFSTYTFNGNKTFVALYDITMLVFESNDDNWTYYGSASYVKYVNIKSDIYDFIYRDGTNGLENSKVKVLVDYSFKHCNCSDFLHGSVCTSSDEYLVDNRKFEFISGTLTYFDEGYVDTYESVNGISSDIIFNVSYDVHNELFKLEVDFSTGSQGSIRDLVINSITMIYIGD